MMASDSELSNTAVSSNKQQSMIRKCRSVERKIENKKVLKSKNATHKDLPIQDIFTEFKSFSKSMNIFAKSKLCSDKSQRNDHATETLHELTSDYIFLDGTNVVGEPRCLALKRPTIDDESDAKSEDVLSIDLDDDNIDIDHENKKIQNAKDDKNDPNDMFFDDYEKDDKGGFEKEEGELSSELDDDNSASEDVYKKYKESLKELDKELTTVKPSNKLKEQLKSLLNEVEKSRKRIQLLVTTKNDSMESRRYSSRKIRQPAKKSSVRFLKHGNGKTHEVSKENDPMKSKSTEDKTRKITSAIDSETFRSNHLPPEKKPTDRRAVQKAHPKERERIQSLFKNQMNLITKCINQPKDDKKQIVVASKSEPVKIILTDLDKMEELKELKTLDDMENFLDVLRDRKSNNPMNLLEQERKRGHLKFTTKRAKTGTQRMLELLTRNQVKNSRLEESQRIVKESNEVDVMKSSVGSETQIGQSKSDSQSSLQGNKNAEMNGSKKNIVTIEEIKKKIDAKRMHQKETLSNVAKNKNLTSTEKNDLVSASSGDHTIKNVNVFQEAEILKSKFKPIPALTIAETNPDVVNEAEQRPKNINIKRKRYTSVHSESCTDTQNEKSRKHFKKDDVITLNSEGEEIDSNNRTRTREFSKRDAVRKSEHMAQNNIFVLNEKKLAELGDYIRFEVINNAVYLVQSKNIHRSSTRLQRSSNRTRDVKYRDGRQNHAALQEMENFLNRIPFNTKSKATQIVHHQGSNSQNRESKFMARIQAKRKAKLMACISSADKEAKFLKALENRDDHSSDTEIKKKSLMRKIQAETDCILLGHKMNRKAPKTMDDDSLNKIKNFLEMIEKAEHGNSEDCQRFSVSFRMKPSDIQKLEDFTKTNADHLSEESQKLLNTLRAKVRAKKMPRTG